MAHQDTAQRAPGGADTHQDGGPSVSPWEWVTAGIGLCCLVGSLGFLALEGLDISTPPQPVIEVVSTQAQQGRYLVQLRVHNAGSSTAAALKVVGELRDGDEVLERRETEFDFLPGESWRGGALFFTRDPARFRLAIEPESFQQP